MPPLYWFEFGRAQTKHRAIASQDRDSAPLVAFAIMLAGICNRASECAIAPDAFDESHPAGYVIWASFLGRASIIIQGFLFICHCYPPFGITSRWN